MSILLVLLIVALILSIAALLVREYIIPLVLGTVIVLAVAVVLQLTSK